MSEEPDITRRLFPKVLADELEAALALVRRLGDEQYMKLLKTYRANMKEGVFAYLENRQGIYKPFPMEHFDKIKALDDAFKRLHHYRENGAADYVAAEVAKAVSRSRSKLPRKRSTKADPNLVADFLRTGNYPENTNRKALIIDATSLFGIKERAVRKIAAAAGLTNRRKQSTAT